MNETELPKHVRDFKIHGFGNNLSWAKRLQYVNAVQNVTIYGHQKKF